MSTEKARLCPAFQEFSLWRGSDNESNAKHFFVSPHQATNDSRMSTEK
jgi:hypothetical protein